MSQNWNTPRFKPGDKVHYVFDDKTSENGIVTKCKDQTCTHVVFECSGNWDRYMDYPAELCPDWNLVLGWKEENTKMSHEQDNNMTEDEFLTKYALEKVYFENISKFTVKYSNEELYCSGEFEYLAEFSKEETVASLFVQLETFSFGFIDKKN